MTLLVIADDLTGANAVAAGLVAAGVRTIVRPYAPSRDGAHDDDPSRQAVVLCTDSRDLPPDEAARRLVGVLDHYGTVGPISLRIDSTLRGSVGRSISTVRSHLERASGRECVALLLPAHPTAGRITVDGIQRYSAQRLGGGTSSEPIADIRDLLREHDSLTVGFIDLETVEHHPENLESTVESLVSSGANVVLGDATTTQHIAAVCAATVAAARRLGRTLCIVDPGPATVAMAELMHPTTPSAAPVLAVSGSTTELTLRQLQHLRARSGARFVDATPLLAGGDVDSLSRDVSEALKSPKTRLVLMATAISDADTIRLDHATCDMASAALAQVARLAIERRRPAGIYLTGGNVAQAVVSALGGTGIDIRGELAPLAAFGYLVGGPWAGMPLVTKGGMVGDDRTAADLVDRLHLLAQLKSAPPDADFPARAATRRGTR